MPGRDRTNPPPPDPAEAFGVAPEDLAGAEVELESHRDFGVDPSHPFGDDDTDIDIKAVTAKLADGTARTIEIPERFLHRDRNTPIDTSGILEWLGIEWPDSKPDPRGWWHDGHLDLGRMPGPPPPDGEPAPLFGVTEQGMLARKVRLTATDPLLTRVDLILELDGDNETSMQMPRRFVKSTGDKAFIDFDALLPWLGIPMRDFNPDIYQDMVERKRGIALGGVGPACINVPQPAGGAVPASIATKPRRERPGYWRPTIIASTIFGMTVILIIILFVAFGRNSDPASTTVGVTSDTVQTQATPPPETTTTVATSTSATEIEDDGMIEYRWVSDVLVSGGGAYKASPMDDPPGGDSWSKKGTAGTPDTSSSIKRTAALTVTFSVRYVEVMFNQSSFPCGAQTDEYRVTCPSGAGEMPEGEVIIVATVLEGPVADGSGQYTYGVAFDDDADDSDNYHAVPPFDADFFDNTEAWYTLQIDPDGGRHVWAGGIVDGAVGYPRYSAAAAIEWDNTVIWVIPRSEIPGDSPAYRTTAFVNNGDLAAIPSPDTAGGDVSGFAVADALTPIDTTLADVTEIVHLPDVEGAVERVDVPPGEEEAHLALVLVSTFEESLNGALAAGDIDAVLALLHPAMLQGPNAQQCRDLVDATISQANSLAITTYPVAPDTSGPIAVYQTIADLNYPTGTVEFAPLLAVGTAGELGLVFPSCA